MSRLRLGGYVNQKIKRRKKKEERRKKHGLILNLKKPRPHSKIPPEEKWKTARLFARVVTRTEGTATRRGFAAITMAPETWPF